MFNVLIEFRIIEPRITLVERANTSNIEKRFGERFIAHPNYLKIIGFKVDQVEINSTILSNDVQLEGDAIYASLYFEFDALFRGKD